MSRLQNDVSSGTLISIQSFKTASDHSQDVIKLATVPDQTIHLSLNAVRTCGAEIK